MILIGPSASEKHVGPILRIKKELYKTIRSCVVPFIYLYTLIFPMQLQ